jgi:type II secretory pathway component PulC
MNDRIPLMRDNRIRLMASANRLLDSLRPWAWTTPVLVLAAIAWLVHTVSSLPGLPAHNGGSAFVLSRPAPQQPASINWTVFARRHDKVVVKAGTLARRFRLVGTFTVHVEKGELPKRRAVLDDAKVQHQHIKEEGDTIEDVTVVSVLADRVVLRDSTGEETLWLSFSKEAGDSDQGLAANGSGGGDAEEGAVNAFGGRRVGKFQWVFQRKALTEYYQELRDNPDRLVKIFDSMEPVRNADRRIEGYLLNVKGEADFYDAVGLQQGDVVRRVNQMDMTSRRRAEYFISEFAKDRANAFVLDIERSGKPEKLIYQVR